MLTPTTQTSHPVLTSVALDHGQRVPQGAKILGLYATLRSTVYCYGTQRAQVINLTPAGDVIVSPVTKPDDLIVVMRVDLLNVSAIVEVCHE